MHVLLHVVKALRFVLALLERDNLGLHIVQFIHNLNISFVDLVCLILAHLQIQRLSAIFGRDRRFAILIESFHLRPLPSKYLEYSIQQYSILVIDVRLDNTSRQHALGFQSTLIQFLSWLVIH